MIDSFILLILNKNTILKKQTIYLFGWITLVVFPIPTFLVLGYFEEKSFSELIDLNSILSLNNLIGILIGIIYAFIALKLLQAPVFDALPDRIESTIRAMKLSTFDMIFLSLCAGVGEELLFRVGVQYYLGPWLTAFIFVAIHGYFNPFNWRKSLYGVIVFPFILLISFAYETFGLWFCIAAHFSYDLVLFLAIGFDEEDDVEE